MAATTFDLLLEGGTVVDGTGAPRRVADVGIIASHIAAIGDLAGAAAARRIDVSGRIVAPGFIDVHSHADRAFDDPEAAAVEGFLRQGVTTVVLGVDGAMSLPRLREISERGENGEIGVNFLSYIGHNSVRRQVMGMAQRPPTGEELNRMRASVRDAMTLGTAGLSTGLMYLPGQFATTEEIVELARVIAPFDGRYDSHVRDPANALLASHRECLAIAAEAGVHAHPAHIKAVGASNFGKGPAMVTMIQSRIDAGEEITVDLYPYDGAATAPVATLLYPGDDPRGEALMIRIAPLLTGKSVSAEAVAGLLAELRAYWKDNAGNDSVLAAARARTETPPPGLYSWIETVGYGSLRVVVSANPRFEGRLVVDLAEELGIPPFELLRRMVVEEGHTAMVTLGAIREADLRILLEQPWAMVASDGEELDPSHPRGRGTFPRLLGRYVREWGVLTLEEAVHKITGLPASYLKLPQRGVLEAGAIADVAVFDPDTIIDRATWSEPTLYATGVDYVLIGGRLALDGGRLQPGRLGRFIPFSSDNTPD
jgi:N-acyl-D-aspartate/D-glutamate deacylase